jgi:hypothetical protein
MKRKATFALIAAGTLIVAAAALGSGPQKPELDPDTGHGVHAYVKGNVLDRCYLDPTECGLVVW